MKIGINTAETICFRQCLQFINSEKIYQWICNMKERQPTTNHNYAMSKEAYKKIMDLLGKIRKADKLTPEEVDYLNEMLWAPGAARLDITGIITEQKLTSWNIYPFYVSLTHPEKDSDLQKYSNQILATLVKLVFECESNVIKPKLLHAIVRACWSGENETLIRDSMLTFFEYIFNTEESDFSDEVRAEAVNGLAQFLVVPELTMKMQLIKGAMVTEFNRPNCCWQLRTAIVNALFVNDKERKAVLIALQESQKEKATPMATGYALKFSIEDMNMELLGGATKEPNTALLQVHTETPHTTNQNVQGRVPVIPKEATGNFYPIITTTTHAATIAKTSTDTTWTSITTTTTDKTTTTTTEDTNSPIDDKDKKFNTIKTFFPAYIKRNEEENNKVVFEFDKKEFDDFEKQNCPTQ
jgi:hypothetical protein